MLRSAAVLAALVLAALAASGCGVRVGDGETVTEERPVAAFDRVELHGSDDVDVDVQEGAEVSVTVRGGKEDVEQVSTRVEDGLLIVDGSDDDDDGPTIHIGGEDLTVVVTVPHLTEATLRGSGDLTVSGVAAGAFKVCLAGSGDVDVTGSAGDLSAELEGSGDLSLDDLEAERATVSLDGSGDVSVRASETLDLNLDGSGDIRYSGAARVSERVDGSGDIERD